MSDKFQMKFAKICIALDAIIAPGSFSGQTTPQPSQSEIVSETRRGCDFHE